MKLVDDDSASIGMFGSNESFGVIETESFLYEENSPYIPGGSYSVSWSGAFLKDQPYEGDNPYIPKPGEPGYPEPGDDDAWFARFKALMRKAEREPVDKEAEAWFAQLNGEKYPLDDDYTQEQHEAFMAKFDIEQPEHQDRADGIMPLRYDEDFYGGKSNPGGGSSDNDDDDDGSGGGGYFGRKPSVPVEDDGYTPRDTDNPPPSDDENNGDGGSSDNDDDDDDDRNGNTQNRQDQSPNDDNEDSDGSPSNDNRNADKRVSFLLQDDFKNFGKDIDNLFAAQSCAVASTCNALIKEFKSQTGKYPYENDIMKGVQKAVDKGHILNTKKDAGYVKDWAGAANTIWNEINPDDGGTWEFPREGSPSDGHSIVALDYLDYNEDEGPDHFSNQETMEVSTSVFRGSSLAAKLPEPLYDHPEAPSVVRRGHVPKKVIKGFSDVTDGEFKAFGRDIDRSFNPDTLYIIRPDGNIRPVDKETAIVGYRYLIYKEADEEKE